MHYYKLAPLGIKILSWLRAGLFAFYGLYQSHSAYSAFLQGTFYDCVWNPAEPFAAEICVPVIGIEVADGQHDPVRIFPSVCKAEANQIGYHLKRDIVQVGLFHTLGDIIRQRIIFRPKRSGFKSIGENIIKAQRPHSFCVKCKNRHLIFPCLFLSLTGKAAGYLIASFLCVCTCKLRVLPYKANDVLHVPPVPAFAVFIYKLREIF